MRPRRLAMKIRRARNQFKTRQITTPRGTRPQAAARSSALTRQAIFPREKSVEKGPPPGWRLADAAAPIGPVRILQR